MNITTVTYKYRSQAHHFLQHVLSSQYTLARVESESSSNNFYLLSISRTRDHSLRSINAQKYFPHPVDCSRYADQLHLSNLQKTQLSGVTSVHGNVGFYSWHLQASVASNARQKHSCQEYLSICTLKGKLENNNGRVKRCNSEKLWQQWDLWEGFKDYQHLCSVIQFITNTFCTVGVLLPP